MSLPLLAFLWARAEAAEPPAHPLFIAPEKALGIYRASLRQSGSLDAYLNAAFALQELGRPQEAVSLLEGALRRFPDAPKLRSALAWGHLNYGSFSQARTHFGEALRLDPSATLDLLGLARAEMELGDLGKAGQRLEELIQKRPRLALSYYYLGKIQEKRDDAAGAVAWYEKALKTDSHFLEARLSTARLQERLGRNEEAWKQYAVVLQADPQAAAAQRGKARLLPLLSRKPEDIVPPKRISRHASVEAVPAGPDNPMLSVGIGSGSSGKPVPRREVSLRAAGPVALAHGLTGKTLAWSSGESSWVIRVDPARPGRCSILNSGGGVVAESSGPILVRPNGPERGTMILAALPYGPGAAWGGLADKEVRGEIELALDPSGKALVVKNHVRLEEYLYGVLTAEMPGSFPLEALKAQAAIARSQALYRKRISRPHGAQGYDVCDSQHCQVYTGVPAETAKARRAVDETRGRVLAFRGRPAHTVFFSNCGGHTQSGAEVGWADVPYWQAVFDGKPPASPPRSLLELREWLQGEPPAYCGASKHAWPADFRWTRVVSVQELEARLSRKASLGGIRALLPVKRSRAGHVLALKVSGVQRDMVLDREHEIRRALGLGPLRSTQFIVETSHRGGKPESFTFYGGGWGHGVGMCQAGAGGRAEQGASYEEVLRHYYPGAALATLTELEQGGKHGAER